MISLSITAAFLVGLFGATHCVGMCGGIVTALEARRRVVVIRALPTTERLGPALRPSSALAGAASSRDLAAAAHVALPQGPGGGAIVRDASSALAHRIAWSMGRIASYTVAGALAGAVGSAAWMAQHVLPVQQSAFVLANGVLLLLGMYLLGWQTPVRMLEGLGQPLWKKIAPAAIRSLSPSAGHRVRPGHRESALGELIGALRVGLTWGWVPCGMVYGVLSASLVSGSAIDGAVVMLAFGLGTLPGLLAAGWAAHHLSLGLHRAGLRRAAGAVIVFLAVAGIVRIDPLARLHDVGVACLQWLQP